MTQPRMELVKREQTPITDDPAKDGAGKMGSDPNTR